MFEQDAQARYFGVTALENIFITEYLPSAKGDYVKVYLSALYHSQTGDDTFGLPELAAELTMPQCDVEAAMRYWERRGVVTLIAGDKPAYRFYSLIQRTLTGQDQAVKPDEGYVAFAESVYAIFGDDRKVRPGEIATAYEWVQDVGLSQEAVLLLLSYMKLTAGKQFSFQRAQKLAVKMRAEGVVSCEDAESYLRFEGETQKGTQDVLRRIGKRRLPSEDELELYKKWRSEWGFAPEAILTACSEMTAAGDPSFKYLDGILARLRTNSNAQTGPQMRQALQKEQDENARVKEFCDALGLKAAFSAALPVYREMAQEMPENVVLLAAQECGRAGAHTLDSVQRLLDVWKEKGITTADAAQKHIARVRGQNTFLQKVFEACGHQGRPTASDRDALEAWRSLGLSDEIILLAAAQASGAEGAKMRYIKKVLENWAGEGVKTIEDARARALSSPSRSASRSKPENGYEQREYTEDELEKAAGTDELLKEARQINGR